MIFSENLLKTPLRHSTFYSSELISNLRVVVKSRITNKYSIAAFRVNEMNKTNFITENDYR